MKMAINETKHFLSNSNVLSENFTNGVTNKFTFCFVLSKYSAITAKVDCL